MLGILLTLYVVGLFYSYELIERFLLYGVVQSGIDLAVCSPRALNFVAGLVTGALLFPLYFYAWPADRLLYEMCWFLVITALPVWTFARLLTFPLIFKVRDEEAVIFASVQVFAFVGTLTLALIALIVFFYVAT